MNIHSFIREKNVLSSLKIKKESTAGRGHAIEYAYEIRDNGHPCEGIAGALQKQPRPVQKNEYTFISNGWLQWGAWDVERWLKNGINEPAVRVHLATAVTGIEKNGCCTIRWPAAGPPGQTGHPDGLRCCQRTHPLGRSGVPARLRLRFGFPWTARPPGHRFARAHADMRNQYKSRHPLGCRPCGSAY